MRGCRAGLDASDLSFLKSSQFDVVVFHLMKLIISILMRNV